jgi:AcrR family transcriptional regulator
VPRKKPRPYHHGDLARVLREEALALLDEVGPEGLTLREVARRAGVSHAAPYRHYPDRRALLLALAVEGIGLLAASIEAALAGAGANMRARFLAAGHAYVRFSIDHRAHYKAAFLTTEVDPAAPELQRASQACFGILLRYIGEAQAAGFFREGDPMEIATSVWAMHQGLASLAAFGALAKMGDLRAVSDAAHGRLLDGLCAPRERAPRGRA